VRADWHPSSEYTGFDGVIHGGVVTTALDEAMAKAIVSTDTKGLTLRAEDEIPSFGSSRN
jgi:acyl-coenzyme A thioesterase PaaI-like protein